MCTVIVVVIIERCVCLQWQVESDMHNTCFICSRSSYDFEHQGSVSLDLESDLFRLNLQLHNLMLDVCTCNYCVIVACLYCSVCKYFEQSCTLTGYQCKIKVYYS